MTDGVVAKFCLAQAADLFANGAPEGIRTPDPQIRSLVLYPAELPAPWEKAGVLPEGSEPPHQRCICSAAVSPVKRPRAASL